MSDIAETLEKMAMPDQDGRQHPCCDDFSEAAREIRELRNRIAELEAEFSALKDTLHVVAGVVDTQKAELAKLRKVADQAAFCFLDLTSNLDSAYKEYMAGEIPHGAYQYVLGRHGGMFTVLHNAGYTEKHKLFGFPVKPQAAEFADTEVKE